MIVSLRLLFYSGGRLADHLRQERLGSGGRDTWNERRWWLWLRCMWELLGMQVAVRRPERAHDHVEDAGERRGEERAWQPKQLRANEQSGEHEERVDVNRASSDAWDQELPLDDAKHDRRKRHHGQTH